MEIWLPVVKCILFNYALRPHLYVPFTTERMLRPFTKLVNGPHRRWPVGAIHEGTIPSWMVMATELGPTSSNAYEFNTWLRRAPTNASTARRSAGLVFWALYQIIACEITARAKQSPGSESWTNVCAAVKLAVRPSLRKMVALLNKLENSPP